MDRRVLDIGSARLVVHPLLQACDRQRLAAGDARRGLGEHERGTR